MFHGLCKGLFGSGKGLKLAQNPVLPFSPWKDVKVGFSERVNDPPAWLHMKSIHWLLCISQVLKPRNVSWPLQGSFRLWYWAKLGRKPSFAIFAMERRPSRVFWKSKRSPEWLHIKAKHWLLCISQVLKPLNVSWPLQGSFRLCYRA